MKKGYIIGVSLIASMLMVGCGSSGGDDGGGSGALEGEVVQITDTQSAENAIASVSSIASATDGFSGYANLYNNVERNTNGDTLFRSLGAEPRYSQTMNCSDGGTMAFNGNESDTSVNMTLTYSNCNEYGTLMNGAIGYVGSYDGYNINVTSTMNNFSVVAGNMESGMNMTLGTKTNDDMDPLEITLSGTAYNKYGNVTQNIGYSDFKMKMSGFNEYYGYAYYEVNGQTSMNSNVNTCANGVYDIATIEPMSTDNTYGGFSSGKVRVNGVTVEFLSGGQAQVTYANGTTETIDQANSVVCN